MFGQLEETRRRSRPLIVLPIAFLLHLVGLVTIVSAQYWHVDTVPEPQENVVFVDLRTPPPPEPQPEPKRVTQPPKGAKAAASQPPAPTPVHTVQQPHAPTDLIPKTDVPQDDVPEIPGPPSPYTGGGDPNPGPPGPPGGGGDGPVGPGGGGNGDTQPLHVGGAVTPPIKIEATAVKPQYTEMARRTRTTGLVIAEAIIDEEGNVTHIRIVKPLPMGLDKAAIEAMARWKFRPATLGGRPVKVYYNLQVNFQVQ